MTKYLTPPAYIKSVPTILTLIMIAGFSNAYGEENASNPLAAVTNIDLRAQYFDLGGSVRRDYYVDGGGHGDPQSENQI